MAGFPVQHPSYFLASLFGKGGLKRAILITFSALLLLVFSATWIFHVRGSREAVLLVTDSLALSAAERISSRLSEHLSMPAALAQANAKLIASAPVIEVESLSISFAAELAAFPDTDIVSAGFMDGEYSEAQRISDSVTRFGLAGKSTGGALELYTLNADGSRTDVKRYEGYDPRKRGWFIEG
ncbi:hypothetical protein MASR2M78_35840 [Treponema sp.]